MTLKSAENKTMFGSLRSAFLAGLVLMAPITVTAYVFDMLVGAVGGRFRDRFFFFIPEEILSRGDLKIFWNFLATLMVLLSITLLGYLSRWVLGKYIVNRTEQIIERLPIINTIYTWVKQIVHTFSTQNRAIFQEVVLVEYPRKGTYGIGFRTSVARGEIQMQSQRELHYIFVPTTPNPTSGYLLLVPREEFIPLNMSVGDAMKLIVSGGAVEPPYTPPATTPANLGGSSGDGAAAMPAE